MASKIWAYSYKAHDCIFTKLFEFTISRLELFFFELPNKLVSTLVLLLGYFNISKNIFAVLNASTALFEAKYIEENL